MKCTKLNGRSSISPKLSNIYDFSSCSNLYRMATPPNANTANANSNTQIIALQAVANNQFISQSTQAIANAIAQGLQFVVLTTFTNCNLTNLLNYYHGLGYQVVLPDVHYQNSYDNAPYSFYGVDYYDWLTNNYIFGELRNPVRMRIMWNLPNNPTPSGGPVTSTQTSNYTMSRNNEIVWADTTSNNIDISLPSLPQDGWVESVTKISANNTLTIDGNGNDINGVSSPIVTNILSTSYTFVFHQGYGWSIF